MDTAAQRVGERVRWREGCEIREHDFAHAHRVDHRLEEDALVFNLRADHDEEAGDDEPGTVQQHAAEHGCEGQQLAETGSGAASGSNAVRTGKTTAEEASSIKRVSRQQ